MRTRRLDWGGSDPASLAREIRLAAPSMGEAGERVREIISLVAERGDEGLREIAVSLGEPTSELRVAPQALSDALVALDPAVREALELAKANLEAVSTAEAQAAGAPVVTELPQGQRVELVSSPVASAGLYAPGGRAPLASSLLMCAVPALVAGVDRIAVASPPGPQGIPAPTVLAVCALCGLDEVYAIGGAQAVAALALGTESIDPVDVVTGPGNRYVQEAKRALYGSVGLDSIAGPSELVVIADAGADPGLVALDVGAQAEHGDDGPLVVISTDRALCDEVGKRATALAEASPSIADALLTLVLAPAIGPALELSDALAPEHLELACADAAAGARERIAGAIFLGAGAATAFGDYAAGSNHVMPTGGSARFSGPLGVGAYLRRSSLVSLPAGAAAALAESVEALARAEGLPVHASSARARAAAPEASASGRSSQRLT